MARKLHKKIGDKNWKKWRERWTKMAAKTGKQIAGTKLTIHFSSLLMNFKEKTVPL
jgi:hypothetical protein